MNQVFLYPVTEMLDITKIEEYNQEFIKTYPNNWEPFVTKNNYAEYLRKMNDCREGKGYGTIICHLLLQEMQKLGFREAIISCYDTNVGSINIIENNSGKLIKTVLGDGSPNSDYLKTRRYKIDIDKSLTEYAARNKLQK